MSLEKLYREMKAAEGKRVLKEDAAPGDLEAKAGSDTAPKAFAGEVAPGNSLAAAAKKENQSMETEVDDDISHGAELAEDEDEDSEDKEKLDEEGDEDEKDKEEISEDEDSEDDKEEVKEARKVKFRGRPMTKFKKHPRGRVNEDDEKEGDDEKLDEEGDEDDKEKDEVSEDAESDAVIAGADKLEGPPESSANAALVEDEDSEEGDEDELDEEDDAEDKKDEKEVNESLRKNRKLASKKVGKLFSGNKALNEEHRGEIQTLFEAALTERTKIIRTSLQEQYSRKLKRKVAKVERNLIESLNIILDDVIAEWKEENKLAIDQGIRSQIVESFMTGVAGLLEDHYVEVPKGKESLLDVMAKENAILEERLNKETAKRRALQEEVVQGRKARVVAKVAKGLTMTERERLSALLEDVDYTDDATFAKKAQHLKENFLNKIKAKEESLEILNEEHTPIEKTDPMYKYATALGKLRNNVIGVEQ